MASLWVNAQAATTGLKWRLGLLLSCLWVSIAMPAQADRPGGVSAQTLVMPHGPASLKGLGESFEPSSSMGTGTYSVGMEVPPGFLAPSVSLSYAGGHGKSELGQGWKLSTLQIYRQTDKGSPNFDEQDRFCVSGGGLNDELVQVNEQLHYYRLKNEGAYALLIRNPEDDSWSIRHADGQTSFLGSAEESREKSRGRTTRWLVDKHTDRFGHWTEYHYFSNRGHVYLDEIAYQLHAAPEYQNTVAFAYEDRPDVFTDYTYGDENTTAQRLTSVQMFHGARLVRTYKLGYDSALLFSLLTSVELTGEDGLKEPKLSFGYLADSTSGGELVTVKNPPPLDAIVDGWGELEDVNADGLPDLITTRATDYRYYENVDGRSFGSARTLRNSPDQELTETGVVFADINGDGFRDLVQPQGDHFRYYPGGDVKGGVFLGFKAAVELKSTSDAFSFTGSELKLGDQNRDGRIDLLWQKPGRDSWLINGKDDVLREQQAPELPVDVDFEDPRIELTDFNGDSLLDFVRKDIGLDSSTLWVWYGLGHGEFTPAKQVPGVPKGDPGEFHLQDVNHDGQADLLRISGSWATVYLNRGSLGFSSAHGNFQGLPAASETLKQLFADMNGNGTTDIVWITKDFKLRYLELSGEPFAGLLSRIDNGMGVVTDIAYHSSSEEAVAAKQRGLPWTYPMASPVPVVAEVHATDSLDALGFRATDTRTTYQYRDGYYDGKEHEFRGFGESEVTSWGDENHETLVTTTRFHVGLNPSSLADEEVLKGRPLSQRETDVDGNVFSSTETTWEARFLCQEDLGGSVTLLPNCQALGDLKGKKDQLIAIAVSPGSLTASMERTTRPRFSYVSTEYDAWGSPTKITNHGEVKYLGEYRPGDPLDLARIQEVPGDEQVKRHQYLRDTAEWLIGLPVEEQLRDILGNIISSERTYYDGLPFGRAVKGLATRDTEYDADRARWVDVEVLEYDSHGNQTATVNAVGDRRELRYDSRGNFAPDRERVLVGADDWITFTAEHDLAYGSITRSTDGNGLEWRDEYDGLGRLVREFEPGFALPSARYEYTFGTPKSPISVTRIDELVDGSGRYHSAWVYSDGAGRSRQRKESAEQPYGYIASGWSETSARGSAIGLFESFPSQSLGLEAPPKNTPVTRVKLDGLGRALQSIHPATTDLPKGSFTLTQYEPWANHTYTEKQSTLGDLKFPVTTRVDGLGRAVEVRKTNQQDGSNVELVWRIGYDPHGAIATFADPLWNGKADDTRHLRHYSYDSLGRLKTVQDPNAGRTDYEYDDINRVTKITNALGQSQTWEYGLASRLVAHRVSADGRGNPGYEHRYHYDAPAPNSPLSAPNDAHLRGHLSWLEFPTGEEHYGFDAQGKLTEEVHRLWNPSTSTFEAQQRDTFRRSFTYRADGLVTRKSVPGGLDLDYSYNERGFAQRVDGKIGSASKTVLADARYDHRGQLKASDLGNGIRACNGFNQRGELTVSASGKATQLNCDGVATALGGLHNLRYSRGYDGMIDAVEDRSDPQAGIDRLDAQYEYDAIAQLTKVTDPRGSTSFSYDQTQNLVRREILNDLRDEPTGVFGYGEGGAGPNAVTSAAGKSYAYDAAGQMLAYNGYDLRFNPEGQLAEANNATTGVRIVQHYDDNGERRLALVYRRGKPVEVHRFVTGEYELHDGEEVWFASAGLASAEVVKSKGVKVDAALLDQLTRYVNGVRDGPKPLPAEYMDLNGDGRLMDAADLAVAQQGFTSETRVGGEKLLWRFTTADHLGSASKTTDSAGDVVSFQRFKAYGKVANKAGQQAYRGGYLGKDTEVDIDLGLQRIGARYYAAALGRWISPDPLIGRNPALMAANPLESNLYSYSRNNPIMVRDPTGLWGEFFKGAWKVAKEAGRDAVKSVKAAGAAIKDVGEATGDFAYGVLNDDHKATIRGGEKVEAALKHFTFEGQAEMAVAAVKDVGHAAVQVGHHGRAAYHACKNGDMAGCGEHVTRALGNGVKVALAVAPVAGELAAGLEGAEVLEAAEAAEVAEGAEAAEATQAAQTSGGCGRICPHTGEEQCFTAGTLVAIANGDVPIEQVHPGQRVLSLGGTRDSSQVDPATWQLVRLAIPEPTGNGDLVEIQLLRPKSWLDSTAAQVGGTIALNIEELKLSGLALVVAIEPCPRIEHGAGEVITGTYARFAATLLRITIERSAQDGEVFEATGPHPFYSLDRDAWVAAEDLRVGERLDSRSGPVRIAAIEQKPGKFRVFNLEVEDAHSYLVGGTGVWVHNAYGRGAGEGPRRTKHGDNRHIDRTKYPDKSKYKKPNQVDKLNKKTMSSPDKVEPQAKGRTRFEKRFGRAIGTNGETTNVVVTDANKIVTHFPKAE